MCARRLMSNLKLEYDERRTMGIRLAGLVGSTLKKSKLKFIYHTPLAVNSSLIATKATTSSAVRCNRMQPTRTVGNSLIHTTFPTLVSRWGGFKF